MRLGKVVKLTVFLLHLLLVIVKLIQTFHGQKFGPDILWTGHFVSGRFWAGQSVTELFVGLPMKILPHMPYAHG